MFPHYLVYQGMSLSVSLSLYIDNGSEEVTNMCEMLDRVMEMGRKEGIEQGIEQGIEKGKLQGYNAAKDEFMDSLLRKDEEIARLKKLLEEK